jgi:hypothetical protein
MRKTALLLRLEAASLLIVLCFTIHTEAFPCYAVGSARIELCAQKQRYIGCSTSYVGQEHCNGSQLDPCAPLDLVILSAKVTYNDEPVACVEIVFRVDGPKNGYFNFTLVRQAQTNASGVVTMSFRIPWPDQYASEIVLGKWWGVAETTVAFQEVSDVHWWYVGNLGDFNGDGYVGPFDFARFSAAYGSTPQSPRWLPEADFDDDQRIGPYDFAFFAISYGKHYP